MLISSPELLDDVRARFAFVDSCPEQNQRIFFENAGGALTLESVVETSAGFAAIPDNQGRDNVASKAGSALIAVAKDETKCFLNAVEGQIFMGESGTELLFRLIRTACLGVKKHGAVIGSSIEHPASRSAAIRWAEIAGLSYIYVPHEDATGLVTAQAYAAHIRPDTRVATILHSSPVTGMAMDVPAISAAIREVAPDCLIIVDGIQYAAHGGVDIEAYGIGGYVISPYKVFSRHGYGLAWISDRLAALPHDSLIGAPDAPWDMGTRDAGAYAAFSDVVDYFEWLDGQYSGVIVGGGPGCVSDAPEDKTPVEARIEAAVLSLMPEIIARDMPFLGGCYGIGILGHHLARAVSKAAYAEPVGTSQCRLTEAGKLDPLTRDLPARFDALVGHKEALQTMPLACAHLISAPTCPFQMIRYKQNIYATQFHPESDAAEFETRINIYKHKGYFPAEEAQTLIDMVHAANVHVPARVLRSFVKRYRRG